MRFTCPSCAKSYRLPPDRLGPAGRAQISCPNCKAVVLVKTGQDENLICQLLGPGAAHDGASPAAANPARTSGAVAAAVPPTWFVVIDREKVGPLNPAQIAERLSSGGLTIHNLAWQKGMAGWTKIEELPELLKELARTGQVSNARQSGAIAAQPVARPTQPAPAPQAAIAPSAPLPAVAPSAPQPAQPAARASQPMPAAPARPVAARPPMPLPSGHSDDDGSGPTMEAAIPVPVPRAEPKAAAKPLAPAAKPAAPTKPAVPPAPAKPEPAAKPVAAPAKSASSSKAHSDAHGDDFFGKHHDLGEVDFSLPDPNKHKPTKEEYQNLIQEFSVMFRLDKRTKRQKVLIGVVLASLLVGAISFGVVLSIGASKKKQLIRDSKEILALFDLGYKQAVTPNVASDSGDAAAAGDPKAAGAAGAAGTAAKKAPPEKISQIADKLQAIVAKKRKAAGPAGSTSMAQRGQGDAAKEAADLAALEQKRIKDAQERARIEAAKYGVVGKVEKQVGESVSMGEELSQKEVSKMCREKEGVLRGCGKKNEVETAFKLKITVVTSGKIDAVVANVDGKPNSALGQCIKGQLGGVRLNAPKATTTYDCHVD